MTTITLTIPVPTPSLNKLLGRHWGHKHKQRAIWGWLVRAARLEAGVYPGTVPPPLRSKLTIHRWAAKKCDDENGRAGTKFLTDSLVKERLIHNDDLPCIGSPEFIQHIGKPYKTVVIISEVA